MKSTLIASTDERHPTYLYFDLETRRYILTAQIGLGGTWVSDERAQEFIDREDTEIVADRPDQDETLKQLWEEQ